MYNLGMIIFFDTETSGLRPGRIIQLSYVILDGENITGKNFFFYTDYIEHSASMVHGITVEKLFKLSGGHTFSEYVDEIQADFDRADLTVAHNFPFDFNFMSAEFCWQDRIFKFKEKFDTMRAFTPYTKIPNKSGKGYKYPKLTELAECFCVFDYDVSRLAVKLFNDTGVSHDARFDVTQTFLCFMAACQNFEEIDNIRKNFANI